MSAGWLGIGDEERWFKAVRGELIRVGHGQVKIIEIMGGYSISTATPFVASP
jgi:hypothetical protein